VRPTLVAALASCADQSLQSKTRHFLLGLSCDELQFIAGYLGSCIVEPARPCCCSRAGYSDQEHKMILLLEFLRRSGMKQGAFRSQLSAFSS
jgi:hypothetical protein